MCIQMYTSNVEENFGLHLSKLEMVLVYLSRGK